MYHGIEFLVPLVLFTSFGAGTEYFHRCADEGTPDLEFIPLKGVAGRYSLEWCAHIDGKVVNVEIDLFWNEKLRSKAKCFSANDLCTDRLHSSFRAELNDTFNCSRVCFISNLDLVYAGYYNLQYKVTKECPSNKRWRMEERCTTTGSYLKNVENNYTDKYFVNSTSIAEDERYGDTSVVTFNFGHIPVTDFKVDLCNESVPAPAQRCAPATGACRVTAVSAVRCVWRVAPGNYSAVFEHLAPWVHGAASPDVDHQWPFSHVGASPAPHISPPPRTLTSSLSWGAGAGALLGAAAAAVLFVRRSRRKRGKALPDSDIESGAASELTSAATTEDILLLYARDSEPFCEAMSQLRELLQQFSSGQVHDLYSATTVSLLAADAAGWVRGTLRRARTLVVLTPYLALNVSGYDAESDHFKRSLLGSEVLYKEPEYGDQLLTVALDQLRRYCATSEIAEYERVLVAEFPNQPTELFPDIASLTRYSLPDDLQALLTRLCGAAPSAAAAGAGGGCTAAAAPRAYVSRRCERRLFIRAGFNQTILM